MSEQKNESPFDWAQAVQENTKPELKEVAGYDNEGNEQKSQVLLVPNGMKAESIKRFLDENKKKPDRRVGQSYVDRLQSFIDITNRFKSERSAIFARGSVDTNSIEAHLLTVFNYHPEGPDNVDADYGDHRAIYEFPISSDFAIWLENNKRAMSQVDFAAFLEEHIAEIRVADDNDRAIIDGLKPKFAEPLEMLELSRDLEIYSSEAYKSKNRLSSGETEIKFSAEHVDGSGKPVKVPDFFVINVPLFEGGDYERIIVRLRYRLQGGSVMWFYDMYRVDQVFRSAFEGAAQAAFDETDVPVYYGSDECK